MNKAFILASTSLLSVLINGGIQAEERARSAEANRRQKAEEARQEAVPIAGQTWREPVTGMEFVWVPAGEFDMGSASSEADNDEKPVHRVYLDGFWIGKYEVTVGEWRIFIRETGYKTEAETGGGLNIWTGSKWELEAGYFWDNPGFAQSESHPVTCVSWNDAQRYISWVNRKAGSSTFRLPTEAEWEYACRSGATEERCGELNDIAWYSENSSESTQPVGRKRPNSYGLYDMLGNVCEWCQDWHGSYASGYVRNPAGPSTGSSRALRGGAWYSGARLVRAAIRASGAPSLRDYYIGFRLARTK